jgi:hypothetical protein
MITFQNWESVIFGYQSKFMPPLKNRRKTMIEIQVHAFLTSTQ